MGLLIRPGDLLNDIEKAENSTGRLLASPDNIGREIENYSTRSKQLVNTGKTLFNAASNEGKKIIDIGKRLQAAFGGVSSNASPNLVKAGFADAVTGANVFIQDTRTSFEDITFKGNGVELMFGIDGFITGNTTLFAPPPMFSFKKQKRVEVTVVDGNTEDVEPGEVVENYGHRPWDITIKGIIIDVENHNYPGDKIEQLIEFFDIDAPWYVTSDICRRHKVAMMHFLEITSEGVQGYEDTWSFTIIAKSFKPVPVKLKQKVLA